MAKNKTKYWPLIGIVILAALIRLVKFNQIPPGLFGDEVDTGYQAYSIATTGRDYFGNLLPIHFQSFGDWRMPLYIYLTVPFLWALGLADWVVRFPSLIFSLFFIITSYGVAQALTKNRLVAFWTGIFVALSSWQFHFSRLALEVTLYGWLFLLGVWFFLQEKWSLKKRLTWACLIWGISVYAYSTAKLFVPLWLMALVIVYRRKYRWRDWLIPLAVFGLVVLPIGFDSLWGQGGARFSSISIFNQPVAQVVIRARTRCGLDNGWERVFHNKGWAYLELIFKNYLASFSTEFLFTRGDPSPRHNPLEIGQLNPSLLPLILVGLYGLGRLWRRQKKLHFLLPLVVIVLTPLPAALTQGGGTHAIRLYQFLPWWQLIAAIGLVEISKLLSRTRRFWFWLGWGGIYLLFTISFYHRYFTHFDRIEWRRWWNEGYRELFTYLNPILDDYESVWISPSWEPPVVYAMFYNQYPPAKAQAELTISPDRLGKFIFRSFDLTTDRMGTDKLMVVPPGELAAKEGITDLATDSRFKILAKFANRDGELVFYVFQLLSLD